MGRVLATADIGSNTVHLLVGEVAPDGVRRLANENLWLSLGAVVAREKAVPANHVEQLLACLHDFHRAAQASRAERFYLFATEAVRKARNHEAIVKLVKREIGLEMNIITPMQEAEMSLRGVLLDSEPIWPLLLIEIGGGSGQIAYVEESGIVQEFSLPIGSGTLIAQSNLTQPASPTQMRRLSALIAHSVEAMPMLPRARRVAASGGVARGIWRAMHPDGARAIAVEELKFLSWDAERLTVDQVVARYGVRVNRAATFLPGALTFWRLLEKFGQFEMFVSEYGVREGALLAMAEGALQGTRL